MKNIALFIVLSAFISGCQNQKEKLTAEKIVNRSIAASGGQLYKEYEVSFMFRNKQYISFFDGTNYVLKRIHIQDSLRIEDVRRGAEFQRFLNGSLLQLADSVEQRYSSSVNSVHYFAKLPFGLNDPAVKKQLLGKQTMNNNTYFKVRVTFDEKNGGEDFDDIYLYWFDTETFLPQYLAYTFHVDGGGMRFREAFNERYINGYQTRTMAMGLYCSQSWCILS